MYIASQLSIVHLGLCSACVCSSRFSNWKTNIRSIYYNTSPTPCTFIYFRAIYHEESSYPKQIKLMISGEGMCCRKVRRIHRYQVPHEIFYPEKVAHHMLLLFYPFKDQKESLSGLLPLYQNKFQEQRV